MLNMLQIKELIKSYAGWVLVLFHTIGLFLLGGEWRDQTASDEAARQMEDAILTRARALRTQDGLF